jgi:hypothetical protein
VYREPIDDVLSTGFDAGVSLDLTLLPLLELGAHAGYAYQGATERAGAFDFWVVGANAALVF